MSNQGLTKTRIAALTRNLAMKVMNTDQSDQQLEAALLIEEPERPRIHTSPSMDKYQNILTSEGKSTGSMNMDEFLNSIWTAEEIEAQSQNANPMVPTTEASTSLTNINPSYHFGQTPKESSDIARQMCLTRQGSPSVPATPCHKTVEELWSEISRPQQGTSNNQDASSRPREPSDEEMSLQEFLVKIGVLSEEGAVAQNPPPRPHCQPQHHLQLHPALPVLQAYQPRPASPLLPQPQLPYGMCSNNDNTTMSNFMITGRGTGSVGVPTPFEPQPQAGGGTVASFLPGGKSSAIGLHPAVSFHGVANGGQKRMTDEPTEVMIEKCEKRRIRNRESATRCRARKRTYIMMLEAEVNQLKHKNACLMQRLKEMERESKQLKFEAAKTEARDKAKGNREH